MYVDNVEIAEKYIIKLDKKIDFYTA